MSINDWISVGSLLVSGIAAFVAIYLNRSLATQNRRLQLATFRIERNTSHAQVLLKHPASLELIGINANAMREYNVSPEDVIFLLLSVNALTAYCEEKHVSIYTELMENDFRQRLFDNNKTRKVWKFARHLVGGSVRLQIDFYLRYFYNETYPELELSEEFRKQSTNLAYRAWESWPPFGQG